MEALVEARHDGRLGPEELDSLERHLEMCQACRQLDESLGAVDSFLRRPMRESSPFERQRGRVRLMRAAAAPARPPRRSGLVFALAALAATLGSVAWATGSLSPAEALYAERLPGAVASGLGRALVWPTEGARFERTTEPGYSSVALDSGGLNLWVRHLRPNERFVVTTTDAEVEVRGTAFHVSAESGLLRAVFVTEGQVEVRTGDRTEMVAAGGSWSPYPPSDAVSVKETAAGPDARAPSLEPRPRGSAHSGTRPATQAPAEGETASQHFADAVQLAERGDYGAAAERLGAFQTQHADDPRAEDAAFLQVIALQKAGREAEATDAAKSYLARYPNGHRAVEARAIAGP